MKREHTILTTSAPILDTYHAYWTPYFIVMRLRMFNSFVKGRTMHDWMKFYIAIFKDVSTLLYISHWCWTTTLHELLVACCFFNSIYLATERNIFWISMHSISHMALYYRDTLCKFNFVDISIFVGHVPSIY